MIWHVVQADQESSLKKQTVHNNSVHHVQACVWILFQPCTYYVKRQIKHQVCLSSHWCTLNHSAPHLFFQLSHKPQPTTTTVYLVVLKARASLYELV